METAVGKEVRRRIFEVHVSDEVVDLFDKLDTVFEFYFSLAKKVRSTEMWRLMLFCQWCLFYYGPITQKRRANVKNWMANPLQICPSLPRHTTDERGAPSGRGIHWRLPICKSVPSPEVGAEVR